MPPDVNGKVKRKKPIKANAMSGQELLFDSYGHAPLRVAKAMTAADLSMTRFAFSNMQFKFHPTPRDSALALTMTIEGLVATYLAYDSWHYLEPSIEIESWGLPCNAFVVSTRPTRDNGTVYATFCNDAKILAISLPHRTSWHKAGLNWLATYKYCCLRHSKNPQPWMGRICNCAVD